MCVRQTSDSNSGGTLAASTLCVCLTTLCAQTVFRVGFHEDIFQFVYADKRISVVSVDLYSAAFGTGHTVVNCFTFPKRRKIFV